MVEFEALSSSFDVEFDTALEITEIDYSKINYEKVKNKPKINDIELLGNKTAEELGLQPKGEYLTEETDPIYTADKPSIAFKADLPTKVSELENDKEYLTNETDPVYIADKPSIALKSEIPTKVSELENDSLFITKTVDNLTNYYKKAETYTKTEVNELIGGISSLKKQIVDTLPTTGETDTIYLVARDRVAPDVYDEYLYINNTWELIGNTETDLSDYYTKTQVDSLIPTKTSELENDSTYVTESMLDNVKVVKLVASTTNVIDFNTLTEPNYYMISNVSTSTATNSPVTSYNGCTVMMLVYKQEVSGYIYQTVLLANAFIRTRSNSSGSWSSWGSEINANVKASNVLAGTFASGMACSAPTSDTHIANKKYVDDTTVPTIATAIPTTVSTKTIYNLGEQSSLTIDLPSGTIGDWVEVQFISGDTATSLTITSASGLSEFTNTIKANKIYTLFFEAVQLDTAQVGWGISMKSYTKASA